VTQNKAVLAHLQTGRTITPIKAQAEYSCWRLASVINRLRKQGHNIKTYMRQSVTGKPYAEYKLEI
jgi:hypothetical protein